MLIHIRCFQSEDHGDVMFSLGYLPSAERLTVVVLKARNLCTQSADSSAKHQPSEYIIVFETQNGKISKLDKHLVPDSIVSFIDFFSLSNGVFHVFLIGI